MAVEMYFLLDYFPLRMYELTSVLLPCLQMLMKLNEDILYHHK